MKYIVTYIEYGDSVDGRARALGVYDSKADAEKAAAKKAEAEKEAANG